METEKKISPEVATSLASAVSLYLTGKYPADDRVVLRNTNKSIIITEGVGGKSITHSIPRTVLAEALSELKVHNPDVYQWIEEGVRGRMKRLYAWRFYVALTSLWGVIDRRLGEHDPKD